ncbi:MAG: pyridoxal-phosphate dependent enzyme, partial [Pseudomonadota bacterium]
APAVKVRGVQARGAEIVFYDRDTESREEIAQYLATSRGAVLVPSYDNAYIIAGQGSVGLEAVQDAAHLGVEFDAVHCCVGGGGLIAGVALAFERLSPQTQIWGAEPDAHDDTARSLDAGMILSNAPGTRSFCDALLSPSPGEMTFAINQRLLDGVGCVSDADVRAAMRFAFEHLKLVVEPGGAAALASILAGRAPVKAGSNILVVLTGGNVDPDLFADVLRRSD